MNSQIELTIEAIDIAEAGRRVQQEIVAVPQTNVDAPK
jgi:hypothetical protein